MIKQHTQRVGILSVG